MIYKDLEQAKNDLQWLAKKCTLPHFSSSRLSAYQYATLEKALNSVEEDSVRLFYEACFDAFHLKKPLWSHHLEQVSLPALALIPEHGLSIVYALEADGSWKSESIEGVKYIKNFHPDTFFTPIKMKPVEKSKKSASKMFKEVALEQKTKLFHAAVATVSINILALATSFYSMQVYDRVIPTQGISTLISLSVGVFIAIFLEMLLKLARSLVLDNTAIQMDIAYSHNIFSRFLKIRLDALPKSIGTLSGQLQSYGSVRSFISSAALYVLIDFPFSLIFLATIILLGGWMMGLIVFIFLVLSILVGALFRHKIDKLTTTSSMASHKKLGLLVEAVENAENVKASGANWSLLSRWNALTEDAIYDDISIRHYSELSSYLAAFLQQVSYVSLVATGAYLASTTDTLTMGGLIAVTILSGRVLSPIGMLPNLFVQWGRAKIAVKDLDNVYALAGDNEGIARPLSPESLSPNYQCKNIHFSYGEDMPTLRVKHLNIKAGERIAILGRIGSGKSTLLKMLAGLYMPQEGTMLINGMDLQHLSRSKLSETIGYLPQSVKLMSGSLRDNLLLGLVGVNDDEIMDAAKKTGLIQLINALPQGLDTPVPEGGESVSGGQKQLIAITRMLLFSPSVWLLDEPTANMDDGTENHILNLLHNAIRANQTLIVVTHKPALLGMVNRIIVLSPEGIVMDGPRDAVLQKLTQPKQPKQPKQPNQKNSPEGNTI